LEKTDRDYIERCLGGYSDDFRFLVRRYEKPLFAYLLCRLRNRLQAQEAAQESLVRAYMGLSKLNKPESFHSWLIGIAARVALEFHRSAQRRIDNLETITEMPAQHQGDSEEYLLDEAIAVLPESQRRVVVLRYYEDLSCRQIAERLQVPLGTVTKMLSRAYVALREKRQGIGLNCLEGSS